MKIRNHDAMIANQQRFHTALAQARQQQSVDYRGLTNRQVTLVWEQRWNGVGGLDQRDLDAIKRRWP